MAHDIALRRALDQTFGDVIVPGELCDTCKEFLELPIIANWQSLFMRFRDPTSFQRPSDTNPIITSGLFLTQKAPHHERLDDLRASAFEGCHLCVILLSARSEANCPSAGDLVVYLEAAGLVVRPHRTPLSSKPPIKLCFSSHQSEVDQDIDLNVQFCPDLPLQQYLYFWWECQLEIEEILMSIDEAPRIFEHDQKLVATHPAHSTCLDTYRKWLALCKAEHPTCNGFHSPDPTERSRPQTPTRLIEITHRGLRLRCFSNHHEAISNPPEYVALSYRWGEQAADCQYHSLLTEDKLENWQNAIEYATLPKTVQDAIYITFRLGFRYLWVDRLCILQDSETDFINEAVKMGQYYLNCTLNIAALSADNADGGFLQAREPLEFQLLNLKDIRLAVLTKQITVEGPTPLSPNDRKGPETRGRTLQTRGWVFQEEHLSPRTLYFGRGYVHWECREAKDIDPFCPPLDESYPAPNVAGWITYTVIPGVKRYPNKLRKAIWARQDVAHGQNIELLKEWHRIVEEYTERALTRDADRWYAIQG